MCVFFVKKRVQGRSSWHVLCGDLGAVQTIGIDRGDLWLSNKTKFSFIGPLNRAKNNFLVRGFSEKNREKIEISWD